MIMNPSYLEELKYAVLNHPDKHFRSMTKEELLADKELLETAAYHFQKGHEDYDVDYEYALHDAMEEILDIYVPGHNDFSKFKDDIPTFEAEKNTDDAFSVITPFGVLSVERKDDDYPGFYIILKENKENAQLLSSDELCLAAVEFDPYEKRFFTRVYEDATNEEPSHVVEHSNVIKESMISLDEKIGEIKKADFNKFDKYSPDKNNRTNDFNR